jgi:uncharacterized damage-inducible protein DinB
MSPSLAAPLVHSLLPEFDAEMARTRRVMERLPEDQFDWQPHPKSMTLGKLASHTAALVGWIADAFKTTDLNLSDNSIATTPPFLARTSAELLAHLDAQSTAAHDTLAAADEAAMTQTWTMRRDDIVLVPPQPRAEIVRHLISHMIHHRGQLMVYLRLLDVPVPGVYGPSADE